MICRQVPNITGIVEEFLFVVLLLLFFCISITEHSIGIDWLSIILHIWVVLISTKEVWVNLLVWINAILIWVFLHLVLLLVVILLLLVLVLVSNWVDLVFIDHLVKVLVLVGWLLLLLRLLLVRVLFWDLLVVVIVWLFVHFSKLNQVYKLYSTTYAFNF